MKNRWALVAVTAIVWAAPVVGSLIQPEAIIFMMMSAIVTLILWAAELT